MTTEPDMGAGMLPSGVRVMPPEWRISREPVDYACALAEMERRVRDIHLGQAPELVWLLEHPPLYSAGTSARDGDLIRPGRFPVYRSGRGGQYTYHGPGQRVAYAMLDLRRRGRDVRQYVCQLEEWVIRTLASFGVTGVRRADRIGVWVVRRGADGVMREDKIAAIGVRIRRWVAYHGIAVNLNPDLSHFAGIVPCGIAAEHYGVTSLAALGCAVDITDLDHALKVAWGEVFNVG